MHVNSNITKIKIIVACHRPCFDFQDKYYSFFHAGNTNCIDPRFEYSKEDMIFFNSGIDVSKDKFLQKHLLGLSELSRVYYAWKCIDGYKEADFIGLCHYRRQFIFNSKLTLPKRLWLPNSSTYIFPSINKAKCYIDASLAENILKEFDIITTKKYNANLLGSKKYKSCKERFMDLDGSPELYDLMEKLLLEYDPSYEVEVRQLRNVPEHYLYNMFIMPRQLFEQYCEMIFPILFKLDDYNTNAKTFTAKRAAGYLAEFLTSMFISHSERVLGLRIAELNTTFIEHPEPIPLNIKVKDVLYLLMVKFKSRILRKEKYIQKYQSLNVIYEEYLNNRGIQSICDKLIKVLL